ncbi:PQQ-binding-like beta-propeller repeat protein [Candidatus Woesearchaeota archaeon]|nr:PQQ-binding-like beta-propeller repeat protein [Candidatus Woesearchaeota archaeon]
MSKISKIILLAFVLIIILPLILGIDWQMYLQTSEGVTNITDIGPDYSKVQDLNYLKNIGIIETIDINSGESIDSQPLINDGILYISSNANLYIINLTDNSKTSFSHACTLAYSTPAIYENKICYGDCSSFYCRNRFTGELLLNYTEESIDFSYQSPKIKEDIIYISSNTKVFAFNLTELSKISELEFPYPSHVPQFLGNPALSENELFAASLGYSESGIVLSCNLSNLSEINWQKEITRTNLQSGPWYNSIIYYNNSIFIPIKTTNTESTPSFIVQYNTQTGEELWQYNLTPYTQMSEKNNFLIYNNRAYITSLDFNWDEGLAEAYLWAFDLNNNSLAWKSNPFTDFIWSTPMITSNNLLYFGSGYMTNQIYAFNLEGSLLWNYSTGGLNGIDSTPAIYNNSLYFGSDDAKIYILHSFTNTKDIDSDGYPDYIDWDDDNDDVNDTIDSINGNLTVLETNNQNNNINNLTIQIDNSEDLQQTLTSNATITFYETEESTEEQKPIINFTFDFSENKLDLSEIKIIKQENTSESGSLIITGIELPEGQTKTVYMDNLNDNINTVCILDQEFTNLAFAGLQEATLECNGENETLLTCNNIESNGYKCTNLGAKYEISGLKHSGISEMKYVIISDQEFLANNTLTLNISEYFNNITYYKVKDPSDLLDCHFENSTICEDYETPENIESTLLEKGINFTNTATIKYDLNNNFNISQGTILITYQPNFNNIPNNLAYLLTTSTLNENPYIINVQKSGDLCFHIFNNTYQSGGDADSSGFGTRLCSSKTDWNSSNEYKIAATWNSETGLVQLYLDNQQLINKTTTLPKYTGNQIKLGNYDNSTGYYYNATLGISDYIADGVIKRLLISNRVYSEQEIYFTPENSDYFKNINITINNEVVTIISKDNQSSTNYIQFKGYDSEGITYSRPIKITINEYVEGSNNENSNSQPPSSSSSSPSSSSSSSNIISSTLPQETKLILDDSQITQDKPIESTESTQENTNNNIADMLDEYSKNSISKNLLTGAVTFADTTIKSKTPSKLAIIILPITLLLLILNSLYKFKSKLKNSE